MKAAPRRSEREITRHLNMFFIEMGLSEVERIPVLGRTGPDISINEMKWVVDAKSRKSVPLCMLAGEDELVFGDGMVVVRRWLDHMHEWTIKHCTNGISVIALRRPGQRVDTTTIIILESQETQWSQRIQHFKQFKLPAS